MADANSTMVAKGLDGLVVDTTEVSQVTPGEQSSLVYRGYDARELADKCSFEEVAYLLLNRELPSRAQLDEFTRTERSQRELDTTLLNAIKTFPKQAHPMD